MLELLLPRIYLDFSNFYFVSQTFLYSSVSSVVKDFDMDPRESA